MGTSKSTPPGITGVGCASKIRRVGRVPLEIYSDPRLADATPLDLLLLVTAYVHARRDDSQRVEGAAAPTVGWLLTDEGEGLTVQDLSRLMKGPEETSRRPLRRLNTRGFLVMSDAFVWGVTGWERPDTRRIRNLRAARKAAAVAPVDAEPDFYPFDTAVPLPVARPTSAARAKVGPQGISNDDAAIAERDCRRPMGSQAIDVVKSVRAHQREAQKLRRRFCAEGSSNALQRDRVQFANDGCFCNPRKDADAAAQSRWAVRWLERYAAFRAENAPQHMKREG